MRKSSRGVPSVYRCENTQIPGRIAYYFDCLLNNRLNHVRVVRSMPFSIQGQVGSWLPTSVVQFFFYFKGMNEKVALAKGR